MASSEKSRSATQSPCELLLDQLTEGVDPDLVDQHLDARAGTVDPQEVLAVEDAEHGLGDLQVVAIIELDELVQDGRQTRHDRGAAADTDRDAAHVAVDARGERDVVDLCDRVIGVGRRERGLDLARHHLRRRVAHEVAHVGTRIGGDVEQLVGERACPRIAGDVAHGVAAAFAAGETGV